MKAGDKVDVAGYEYTVWSQAKANGHWYATREQSPTVTVQAEIMKSSGRWKVTRQWLTSRVPDNRPPVDSNHIPMRRSPSDTQQAMVAKYLPRAGTKRALIYDLIIEHEGLTDDEIEVITGFLHQSASATRNSLMNDGWITDSGERRRNRNGNPAIVWVIDNSHLEGGTPASEPDDNPSTSPVPVPPSPAPTATRPTGIPVSGPDDWDFHIPDHAHTNPCAVCDPVIDGNTALVDDSDKFGSLR